MVEVVDQRPPQIPDRVLGYLDQMFPERSAELGMTEQQIWFQAGQRSVVRHLHSLNDEDQALTTLNVR